MLFDLGISLMLAGAIMFIIRLAQYLHDRRCPDCGGEGIISLWDGSPAGCPRCEGRGYLF